VRESLVLNYMNTWSAKNRTVFESW